MSFWEFFWAALLIFGLAIFTGLAVVVAIGGFADIRAMFRNIDRQHEREIEANGLDGIGREVEGDKETP